MARLHKTLADYLVIAVSPALIMVLIGSLVFFLVDVFYEGLHQGRLEFVLGCFVFAAVLIGRIAIEIGKEHAMMYAAPLALVTAMALDRFVEFHGRAAPYALLINLGLMGLIWYGAHKLTWDCTMVDESQDASGEGLLQRLGLEKGRREEEEKGTREEGEKERTGGSVSPSPLLPFSSSPHPPTTRPPSPATPEGVTGGQDRPRPWWERLRPTFGRCPPPRRPHSPGASVVWFSLVALAMFGVGQFFIPVSDAARRRHAFTMLVLFVACALGLLLTTSFLGLRRYLRQRWLQMPATMAGMWIAIGCSLIAAVLAFAVLLPRPNPEYAVSQVPWKASSPQRGSSPSAVGRDAAEKDAQGSPTGQDQRPPDEQKGDREPTGGTEGQKRPDAQNAGRPTEEARGEQEKPAAARGKSGSEQGEGKSGDGDSDKGAGGGKSEGKGPSKGGGSRRGSSAQPSKGQQRAESKGDSQQSDQDAQKGQGKEAGDGERGTGKTSQKGRQGSDAGRGARGNDKIKPPSSASRPPSAAPRPSPRSPSPPSIGIEWLASLLKWLVYGVVIIAAVYWLWRSRHQLPEMLRRLLEAWRGFWSWLFGRKRGDRPGTASEEEPQAPSSRRFADFVDPFAAGTADRWPPDELVRYSFEALEAWGRDNGLPREPDQTPYEFSQRIGGRVESLTADLRTLADLYYRAAYARGSLSAAGVRPLERFWKRLGAEMK